MKKLFKVALVAGCMMLFLGNFAKAQTKVGYIAFDQVLTALPEFKTVQTQMAAYQKTWTDQLQALGNEINTKGQEFQTKSATMTDAIRTSKQAELQDMQKRYQDLSTNAQQQVEAKSNELSKPLIEKVRTAVNAVAKEKGYTLVLNSASTDLVVSSPTDDLGPAVKLKLGLK